MSEPARAAKPVNDALTDGKRKAAAGRARPPVGSAGLFALQRSAGNSAVNALLAGRWRSPSEEARSDIDAALRETRRDEPAIDTVEKGLKRAKAVGIPVELEGPKPPPAALAVTKTGFGPASVAPKKPVPPTKPVPKVSPLGKAAAKRAKAGGGGPRGAAPPAAPTGGGGATAIPAAPLSADQLLQPPVAPKTVAPDQDPAFKQVTGNVKAFARDKRAHPPAASKAKEAQDAALAPTDDLAGQAKEAKAVTMDAQQAGSFDQKAFIAAVKAAIEAKSPKTLTEADNYAKSGKAGEVKGEVKGLVTQGKEGQAKDIETATAAPPDTSKSVPKPVTPMGPEQQSGAPPIPAAGAVPKPAPPEQLNLEAGKHQADQEMADAEVSEQQLAQSNEPDFQQALADKKAAAAHADTAPGEFRKQEQDVITQTKTEAGAETKAGVTGMQGAKGAALAKLVADKGKTKSKDEAKRAEVTAKVQSIYAKTEKEVKEILEAIDPKVETEFEQGEKGARAVFESYVNAKMSAYKKDRYSGWLGGYRWLRDKLKGMPAKVNEFYEAGRELYLKQMDGVISRVAKIVGDYLMAAKKRIAAGKTEIASYVKSLPANLKKVGAEASKEIADKFEQLEEDVNAKQESVIDTLASKYVESRKGLDERIEELQAENKGLIDKAIDGIKNAVKVVLMLRDLFLDVLSKAASALGSILAHPVRFIENFMSAVSDGFALFGKNIFKHLKAGVIGWLTGEMKGEVELPSSFDEKGLLQLAGSILGLSWDNLKKRIKRLAPWAVTVIDQVVEKSEVIKIVFTDGIGGLAKWISAQIGNLKDMILAPIKQFVQDEIIEAGIATFFKMLSPAGALIKIVQALVGVVKWIIERAAALKEFIETVINAVVEIARGGVAGVPQKIEDALAKAVPLVISLLANILGLGGFSDKIRAVIKRIQKPIMDAVDFVLKGALKLAGPIIRGLKGIGGKVKAKVAAGKAYVKGKAEAGKKWVKGKAAGAVRAVRDWFTLRKSFTATDGAAHTLYWTGRGPGAKLTVASAPTPVDAVLVTAAQLIKQGHPEHGALQAAQTQQNEIVRLRKIVEQPGPGARQAADVDALNKAMEKLVELLAPLVPIVFPATAPAPPGALPPWVQPFKLVKLKGRAVVARVLDIQTREMSVSGPGPKNAPRVNVQQQMVQFQILRPRSKPDETFHNPLKGAVVGKPEWHTPESVKRDCEMYPDDGTKRMYYMGPNPRVDMPIGLEVKNRMRAEGKIEGDRVRYGRDANGETLPPGEFTWWPISACVMGHIIDAVIWWNTNGRFTGPQSDEVEKFMTDADNYEIEPSGPNSLRGALLGGRQRYLDSAK
jgi:hypothetical protein